MPSGRKPSRSREEYVEAAIGFADAQGINSLTLRALGKAMGASTTAMYRYFPDKETLLAAIRDELLARSITGASAAFGPLEVIRAAALGFREQVRVHPCLSQLMILSRLEGPAASAVPTLIAAALEELGLTGRDLVIAYRQLESYVVGSCIFDFADAPSHLSERLTRMSAVERSDFQEIFTDVASIEEINEQAFAAGLTFLLDRWQANRT